MYFVIKYVPKMLASNCNNPAPSFNTGRKKKRVTDMLKRCLHAGIDEGMRMKRLPSG
jgi:hypothetical protein